MAKLFGSLSNEMGRPMCAVAVDNCAVAAAGVVVVVTNIVFELILVVSVVAVDVAVAARLRDERWPFIL